MIYRLVSSSAFCCFYFFCLLFASAQVGLDREDYEVRVEQGILLGKLWTVDGRKVQVFKGVPYAEPPDGERRFKKPMKKQPWQQPELSARTAGRACIQFMDFHVNDRFSKKSMKEQGEDCLYLNIYAPFDESFAQVFPVLVWIHGGSYLAGSGDTGVDEEVAIRNLVLRDVVLVTINYRLGPLGFVSSDVEDQKGNFGLWDQIEALRWVKTNIDQFGGNPDAVTVMGESAGAASVSILALSPVTQDLMHSAIIMSGSGAAGWAVQRTGKSGYDVKNLYQFFTCKQQFSRDDLAHIFRSTNVSLDTPGSCNLLKSALDCSASDDEGILECLRKADFSDPFFRKALTIELGVSKAVVDGEIIPYAIDELIANATRIPIMTGVAGAEWFHKKQHQHLKPFPLNVECLSVIARPAVAKICGWCNRPFETVLSSRDAGEEKVYSHTRYDVFIFDSCERVIIRPSLISATLASTLAVRANVRLCWCVLAKYYGLGAYKPVNESVAREKVQGIIQESLKPRLTVEASNFTLNILGEAAFLRYIKEESSATEWERTSFLRRLQTLEADIEFVAPCQREIESYAAAGLPVYLYSFEHVPKSSFLEEDWTWQDLFGDKRFTRVKRLLRFDSPFHGLDHAYIFNKGYTNNMDFQYDEEDKKMSDLLCNLITNFVKYKNPTPSKIDDVVWQPYTKKERRYARIRVPFTVVDSEFYRSKSSFWNEFMPALANRLTTVEGDHRPSALTDEERIQLAAYKKAWWALWILVAAIAVVLWTIVICLVAQKCISAKSGPYKNIIVANR